MTKKIAILTQPLHTNFGGTLQAYALQKVLKNMGYNVETINYRSKEASDLRKLLSAFKQFFKCSDIFQFNSKQLEKIQAQHKKFISSYINLSVEINNVDQLSTYFLDKKIDAVVVGSDQVWRAEYSPRIESYFLDFLEKDKVIKKISYAASFGLEKWCFSQELTLKLAEHAGNFHSISVRENSAVGLCKQNLNVAAQQVLDPTLLLDRNDYIKLLNNNEPKNNNKIFRYILDMTEHKQNIVNKISEQLGGKQVFINQPLKKHKDKFILNDSDLSDYVYPSIESWLQSFNDADFIITDSFHGTVFSIIFNKPFVSIKNKERGNSRFESLLKIFGLEDRLITDATDLDVNKLADIDFEKVNQIRKQKVKESLDWLKKALV